MPKPRKPRKAYRPRRISLDPVEEAVAGAGKMPAHQRVAFVRLLQQAVDGLRDGSGGAAAWCQLADGLNVAEQLALAGICSDRLGEVLAAQEALSALHERQLHQHTYTLRASELAALREGVLFAQIQLEFVSQTEFIAARDKVVRKVQAALAGNASPKTIVCLGPLGTAKPKHSQQHSH